MKKTVKTFKVKTFNLEAPKQVQKYEALMSRAYQDNSKVEITEEERIMKSVTMTDEEGGVTNIQQIWIMIKYLETTILEVASKKDVF